jgi:two-component system osmolarity sensor histidine kinase EnvZ
MWMVGTSLVLLGIAVIFLRNQIRPILRLAEAAESFGKGRDIEFRPRGDQEVVQAGHAFVEMRRRIERSIEQRTAMLNGVSHDLRTILTRFKLSLALLHGDDDDVELMKKDVDEMTRMLEAYLAFARGDAGERPAPTDIRVLLGPTALRCRAPWPCHHGRDEGPHPSSPVRPDAFKRCLGNLVSNAARHGDRIASRRRPPTTAGRLSYVDGNGPGVPAERRREVVERLRAPRRRPAIWMAAAPAAGSWLARATIARPAWRRRRAAGGVLGGLRAGVRTLPV